MAPIERGNIKAYSMSNLARIAFLKMSLTMKKMTKNSKKDKRMRISRLKGNKTPISVKRLLGI